MTRQILSSLIIAAAAMFAAAVPTLAQSHPAEFRESDQAAMTVVESIVALNRIPAGVTAEKKSTAKVTTVAQPNLSVDLFRQSAKQFSNGASQRLTSAPSIISEPRSFDSRKQFRADDETRPSSRRRIEFVPSRGQKLPN
jgi:hypothetical protein